MAAITIADLNTAKLDVDHIAEIATSTALTATDRLGNEKRTLAGALSEFPDAPEKAAEAATSAAAAATSAASASASASTALAAVAEGIEVGVSAVTTLATTAATTATSAKIQAEAARDAAVVNSTMYPDIATGRAAVADGAYFKVIGTGDVACTEYRRTNSTTSVLVATYPSTAVVSTLAELTRTDTSPGEEVFKVVDEEGFAGLALLEDFTIKTPVSDLGVDGVDTPVFSLRGSVAEGFRVVDLDGFVGLDTSIEDAAPVATSSLAERNATNLLPTILATKPSGSNVQGPTAKLNVWIVYGQSFSIGSQSAAALSTVGKFGNKMLGASPRGGDPQAVGTTFAPIGGNVLQDLIGVQQNNTDGSIVVGSGAYYGESVLPGWLNGLKRLHNDRFCKANDTDHIFAGAECGVGGRTIAQLSKGATPNLYNRYLTALSGFKAAADAAGYDMVVCGILWMQGENDGGAAQATYLASLRQLHTDMVADAKAATGQPRPPAFYLYQTGGSYASDVMGVCGAQIEFVKTTPGAFFTGPVFPYADPGAHLYANSYRWYGAQAAKVAHQVALGHNPVPFSMRAATYSGAVVLVDFIVPVPPLKFSTPYDGATAQDYASKGFTVIDSAGTLTGESVVPVIVSDTVIQLTCSRDLTGSVKVVLGDKSNFNGNHCVSDSDPAVADESWVYGVTGQLAGENIAALLNKPYPLNNWAASGTVIATYQP